MKNIFRCFSKRFFSENNIVDEKKESQERQENIDKMVQEGILERPKDGKRYAINKITMSMYEIVDEKDSFFLVKDKDEKTTWDLKENYYADNIVYSTKEDFIKKEKDKLLSLIDTARYDVYSPINVYYLFGGPSVESIEKVEKQNAEDILKFIGNHTTADFKDGGAIFSNYILIGF